MSETVISFHELCASESDAAPRLSDSSRNLLEYADVVIAEERKVPSRTVIFGRRALQNVVVPGEIRGLSIVVVTIDSHDAAEQFHQLCSVVKGVKGRHECSPEDRIHWREELLKLLAQTEQSIAELESATNASDAGDPTQRARSGLLADLQKAEREIQLLLGDATPRDQRGAPSPRDP